jgi:hypothetical protein
MENVGQQSPRSIQPAGAARHAWPLRFVRKNARSFVVAAICGGGGATYAYFVGCRTGTCLLSSNVWVATFYWSCVGFIAGLPIGEKLGER